LGVGRINVGNPLGDANCTMGLLHWKSKFNSTLLPLEFVLEDEIDQGGMTRGNISSMFWLNWKKGYMLSILCFLVIAITFKTKLQNKKLLAHVAQWKTPKQSNAKWMCAICKWQQLDSIENAKKERCKLKNLYLLIVVFAMKSNLMTNCNKCSTTTTNSSLLPTTMFYNHTSLILCCNFNF
jgi:hypothetical protein